MSKELLNLEYLKHHCYSHSNKQYNNIKHALEVLEIIKANPEIVWWCVCYKNAYEMIIDRKGFMYDYTINEVIEKFNLVKGWLNEKD